MGEHATVKYYVDQSIDEPIFAKNIEKNVLMSHFLSNISEISLNLEPIDDNHVATKSHVYFLSEHGRSRRDMSTVFHN